MATFEKTGSFISGCWSGLGVGCGFVVLNLIWVGLLAWGAWYGYDSYKLSTDGQTVTGVVTGNERHSNDDGTSYSPIIAYDVDGRTYQLHSQNSADPPKYAEGDQVTLRYNPAQPDQARINDFWELWLLPGILVPAGLLMALLVNVGYLVSWRRGTLFIGSGLDL